MHSPRFSFFFFNDTATTEIYTLSLHDALPIFSQGPPGHRCPGLVLPGGGRPAAHPHLSRAGAHHGAVPDRKSTRLNSSHGYISYAVFCLKKKIVHATKEHRQPVPDYLPAFTLY